MTDALYLDDSTVRQFEARVERTLDGRLVLDRTHFYPDGGGQPADHGQLVVEGTADGTGDGPSDGDGDGAEPETHTLVVTDVEKRDTIYHHVDGELPEPGTTVVGRLDWPRRYAHMQYHTAQHLLSAVLLEEFDAPTVGNQLYDDRARIDVAYPKFSETDLADIEAAMNDLIDRDLAVDWYTMERERAERELDTERTRIDLLPDSIRELRIVEIRDGASDDAVVDRTACAGTHVSSTGELGPFRTTGRTTQGADRERVSFVLG